jgi:hypothetical protein
MPEYNVSPSLSKAVETIRQDFERIRRVGKPLGHHLRIIERGWGNLSLLSTTFDGGKL